ncbi:putative essential protein yae1 [Diplodia seriata]|uniref:Putative essential protein yae1 n=1 Tax=Diplodia seriata TaxID=420778 RepID=A0A0G2FXW8_9PEZI|nr:putative essential protein yae1 [Diplodia seriata]
MDPTTATDLDLQDLDPFDSVLSLEDSYYTEGHALGVADGSRAGRIEGRVFGLEKGFEKFVAMGALHGKAAVWASRLPPPPPQEQTPEQTTTTSTNSLPPLLPSSGGSGNPRLAKHITTLHALSEPASLSTQNDEDAVADFDDRFKRAQAKVKIVEKLVGEGQDHREANAAMDARVMI